MLKGIIHVTGEHDVGKTTFALEAASDPGKICFFDDDLKGSATVRQIKEAGIQFGAYHDLTALAAEKPLEYDFHAEVQKRLKEIKQGQFEVIIFDTWTSFASSCYAVVRKHEKKFREFYAADGRIKGSQYWQEAQNYESRIIAQLAEKCDRLILITHLKDLYMSQAKVPDKQVPACSRTIEKVCNLRLWLRRNPPFAVPQALVLKRIDKKIFVKGKGLRTVNVLPLKIVPKVEETSLWDSIQRYWDDPVGSRILDGDEIPTEKELSIISSTMSNDQFELFHSMVKAGLIQPESSDDSAGEVLRQRVTELLAQTGMKEEEVLSKLKWDKEQLLKPTENMVNRLAQLVSINNEVKK